MVVIVLFWTILQSEISGLDSNPEHSLSFPMGVFQEEKLCGQVVYCDNTLQTSTSCHNCLLRYGDMKFQKFVLYSRQVVYYTTETIEISKNHHMGILLVSCMEFVLIHSFVILPTPRHYQRVRIGLI